MTGTELLPAPLWLGIDLGTQSVKVSVVDGSGLVHAAATSPLLSMREGKRHEQDPGDWISQSRKAVATALASLPEQDRARISGIAVCATSGTITTVDEAGRPLSPGLMYDDARAGDLSDEAAAADPALWRRLGYRIQPTWALPKIVWLSRQGFLSRLAVSQTVHIATQADVLTAALTGGPVASDWSHSLKSGYDLLAGEWPQSVLTTLGIDARHLPTVVAPGTLLGHSAPDWTETTGLPAGVPVFAGMTDGCAAQLGAGTLALGDWHTVIGTTLVVKGVSDRIVVDDSGAIYSHRAPHDGLWFPGGASSVGAGAISQAFPGEDLRERSERVARNFSESIDTIPLCYPLPGHGERFPVVRPDATGFVRVSGADVPLDEAAAHLDGDTLFAALMLGIALVERLAVDSMTAAGSTVTGTFSSSGGGTKNPWWNQLRADLLGRTITIPVSAEGSVGMAILAAWASAQLSTRDSGLPAEDAPTLPHIAQAMSLVGSVVQPDLHRSAALQKRYDLFRRTLVEKGWLAQ